MMTPRNPDGCHQGFMQWANPADNNNMPRRNSVQHVPFMDFSFFPVREETSDLAKPSAGDIADHDILTGTAASSVPGHTHHQYHFYHTMDPLPFDSDDRSSGSERASEPSLAPSSIDSSEHSLSSSSVVYSSSDSSSENQRFKPFHEEKWSHRYKELVEFHKKFGHSAVPHTYPMNPQLARWVKRQRRQYKLQKEGRPSTMTLERLELLATVGFIWDSHDLNWREKLEMLTAFRMSHGHCNVPSNYGDKKLATWVKCQRRQYKLYRDGKPSAMTVDRISALEHVGFEWEIRNTRAGQPTAKVAAEEEDPLSVFAPSSMGTGEQMFLVETLSSL